MNTTTTSTLPFPGIVRSYLQTSPYETENGYLIQQTEEGFRFLFVDEDESDPVRGDFFPTEKRALLSALDNWNRFSGDETTGGLDMTELVRDAQELDAGEIEAIAATVRKEFSGLLTAVQQRALVEAVVSTVDSLSAATLVGRSL